MGVPAGSVHAHTPTEPSRAGAVVGRIELVQLGVGTWLGHGLEKTEASSVTTFSRFLFRSTERNPTIRVLAGRMCLSTATLGPCPQHMLQVVLSGPPSH